jgi:hypothetical protein
MQTIEVKKGLQIGLDELAQRLSQLDSIELTAFFAQLNEKIIGQPKFNNLSEETILLKKIKYVIPASVIRHYRALRTKARKQVISDKDRQELLLLSDFIEEKSAEKVNLLAALAKIKQVPLSELLQQFAIKHIS